MALPYLIFDYVARHSGGSTAAAQIANLATRMATLGWNVEVGTGSFVDMIACRPPNSGGGASLQDMRVVFSASSSGLTRTMQSPDTYATNALHVAVAKGVSTALESGTATGNPFSTGTFSGFWRATPNLNVEKYLTIAASDETILLALDTNTNVSYPCYVGAIINSNSNNYAESSGRLIGMMTCVAGLTPSTVFWGSLTVTQTVFVHGTTSGQNHTGVFEPGGSGWVTLSRWAGAPNSAVSGTKRNPVGETVGNALAVGLSTDITNTPIGKVRQVYHWEDGKHGEVQHEDDDPGGTPTQGQELVLLFSADPSNDSDAMAVPLADLRQP